MSLPYMSDKSIMRPTVRTQFGGLNHNKSAGDGEIFWMENMCSREFPLLSPRRQRRQVTTLDNTACGLGAKDALFWVDHPYFYYDGEKVGELVDTQERPHRQFAVMGDLILIFPDKKYYDVRSGEFGNLNNGASFTGVSFQNGVYEDVPANANTIYKAGAAWTFSAGDAVDISGCVVHPENNKTAIIREVDGDYLRFYEGTFTLDSVLRYTADEEGLSAGTYHFAPEETVVEFDLASDLAEGDTLTWNGTGIDAVIGGVSSVITVAEGDDGDPIVFADVPVDYVETGTVSVGREVPDLDFVCVNENRLWGCKGDTIYASALGDPFNFNVFDGLSTDSWQSSVTDAGDFTACVSFNGYPIFFKENSICKVQGDKPSNFQWTQTSRFGVKEGCSRSLAVAGDTLYYFSRAGVCAYTGGTPKVISDALGANIEWTSETRHGVTGGSDGIRYWMSVYNNTESINNLFCYDTRYGGWWREDDLDAESMVCFEGRIYMLSTDKGIYTVGGEDGTLEDPVSWEVKFADSVRFYETSDSNSQNKKGLSRLMLRCELAADAVITVSVSYDKGSWHQMAQIKGASATPWDSTGGNKMNSYNVPLILRRCDSYRIKLTGTGNAVVYSLTEVKYAGSNLQGGALYKEE